MVDDSESFIYGGKYGVGVVFKNGGMFKLLKWFWFEEEEKDGKMKKMRVNDGVVDSKGWFWVSVVCDLEVILFVFEGDFVILL